MTPWTPRERDVLGVELAGQLRQLREPAAAAGEQLPAPRELRRWYTARTLDCPVCGSGGFGDCVCPTPPAMCCHPDGTEHPAELDERLGLYRTCDGTLEPWARFTLTAITSAALSLAAMLGLLVTHWCNVWQWSR